jgi:hypothetical protein
MIDWKVYARQHPQFGPWYTRAERQPSWVVKTAVALAVVTIVLPLALLTLAAVAVGLIAFLVLGAAAMAINSLATLLRGDWTRTGGHAPPVPRDDGRRNVRIIR